MKTKNNGNNLLELLSIEQPETTAGMIKTQKQEMYVHQVFLDEDIGPPSKYRDLISMLYSSSEMDTFNLLINSGGGEAAAAGSIIEAINCTEAHVRAVLLGDCHSAASMIALNCDEVIVLESSTMMIHTCTFGTAGNTHLVKGHVDFSAKIINNLLDRTYEGFLTNDELETVKKGQEIWLDCNDIEKRLESRFEYQKDKMKQIETAVKILPPIKKAKPEQAVKVAKKTTK